MTYHKNIHNTRSTRFTTDQVTMFLESIPQDRFITRSEMVEDMKPMGLSKEQVLKKLASFVNDGLVVKIIPLNDGRKRLYRRKGAMG